MLGTLLEGLQGGGGAAEMGVYKERRFEKHYLEGIRESLLLEQSDFLFCCCLSLVLKGAVLPDLDPSITPTRGHQPLLDSPHCHGPYLVLMPIKGIQALSAAHIPQLHESICAAGQQLHDHNHFCYCLLPCLLLLHVTLNTDVSYNHQDRHCARWTKQVEEELEHMINLHQYQNKFKI